MNSAIGSLALATVILMAACSDANEADTAGIDTPPVPEAVEAASDQFAGRYFESSIGVGETGLALFPTPYSDIRALAADSELVFVGRLVGSKADVAETPMISEPGIDEQTHLVWDSLEFEITRVIQGDSNATSVSIGHPAFIRYEEGLARLQMPPVELLRDELRAKHGSESWLVFAKRNSDSGLLTIETGRLVRLTETGMIAAGGQGLFLNRGEGSAFQASVDDLDRYLNDGIALPRPESRDLTREELEELDVPRGTLLVEPSSEPMPSSPCQGLRGEELKAAESEGRC